MNALSVEVVKEGIEDETIILLLEIYEEITSLEKTAPPIDFLYDVFKNRWTKDMYDFVSSNADSWEIDMREVFPENLVEKMNEWGFEDFVIPSHIKIYRVLNYFGLNYITNQNQMVNGAVIEVW